MNKNSILPLDSKKEREKKTLQRIIYKRREVLLRWVTKTEMLNVELEMVRQEYDIRVGKLYLKSNQQDLDIIYYKNLLQLLDEGKTYDEAILEIEETYYAQQRKLDQEEEYIRTEQEIYKKRNEAKDNTSFADIKSLWKTLVTMFHPDLTQEPAEKSRREEIIKQVNRAYQERDYNRLKQMETELQVDAYEETTLEKLAQILEDIENEIIRQEEAYKTLRLSVWFRWKINIEKAKKKKTDIFADIELSLLNEITQKIAIIEKIKEEIDQRKTSIRERI
jgi:hypothetical protein